MVLNSPTSGASKRSVNSALFGSSRIGAAAKLNGISYSQLIHGLKLAGIELDRKILAELAVHDPAGFTALTAQAKTALNKTAAA